MIHIISVEDFHKEFLVFLEGKGDVDRLDEFRVQVVEYHFSLPFLLLLITFELPENTKCISFGLLVQVWKVLAREGEHEALSKAVIEV